MLSKFKTHLAWRIFHIEHNDVKLVLRALPRLKFLNKRNFVCKFVGNPEPMSSWANPFQVAVDLFFKGFYTHIPYQRRGKQAPLYYSGVPVLLLLHLSIYRLWNNHIQCMARQLNRIGICSAWKDSTRATGVYSTNCAYILPNKVHEYFPTSAEV